MGEFSIQLTDSDLKLLLKHVFLGNWVLTATQTANDKNIDDFYQKILKLVKNTNIESGIEKDKKSNQLFLNQKLESEYIEDIEAYNEDTFYEEIVDRLTKRDINKSYSSEELQKMNEMKFNTIFDKLEGRYIDEIEKNGLENIDIISQKK